MAWKISITADLIKPAAALVAAVVTTLSALVGGVTWFDGYLTRTIRAELARDRAIEAVSTLSDMLSTMAGDDEKRSDTLERLRSWCSQIDEPRPSACD